MFGPCADKRYAALVRCGPCKAPLAAADSPPARLATSTALTSVHVSRFLVDRETIVCKQRLAHHTAVRALMRRPPKSGRAALCPSHNSVPPRHGPLETPARKAAKRCRPAQSCLVQSAPYRRMALPNRSTLAPIMCKRGGSGKHPQSHVWLDAAHV